MQQPISRATQLRASIGLRAAIHPSSSISVPSDGESNVPTREVLAAHCLAIVKRN